MSATDKSPDPLKNTAKIWMASPGDLSDDETHESNLALLNDVEQARYRRFMFDRDRIAFLAAHALLRRALSRYAPVPATAWTFETNDYGRPEIAGEHTAHRLRFNLTHAKKLVACIITRNIDCGIDVESIGRLSDPVTVTKRFFTEQEYQAIKSLPQEEQENRFTETWTLKEAYVKTLGLGLSASLKGAWFDLDHDDELRVTFKENNKAEQTSWKFHQAKPNKTHHLAAAVRCKNAKRIKFQTNIIDLKNKTKSP